MCEEFILNGPKPIVPVSNDSIGVQLFDKLSKYKNKRIAFVDAETQQQITYETLLNISCQLAESLRNYGVRQNEVVAICSDSNLEYFYPVISAMFLGAIVTVINASSTSREIIHCLNIARPSVVFCSKSTFKSLLEVEAQTHLIEKLILLDGKEEGLDSVATFIARYCDVNYSIGKFRPIEANIVEQVAFITYSSGTTGLPKGVMMTHRNINIRNSNNKDKRFYKYFNPGNEYVFNVLPFFHAYGLFSTLLLLLVGRPVVVLKKFELHLFLKTIEKYKITFFNLVPSLVVALAKSPLIAKYDLSSIEEISCGSAPLSKEAEELLTKQLKVKVFKQSYGLTETLGLITMPYNEDRAGSCGKVLPHLSAKVLDPETRSTLGPNRVGELYFKGDSIMKGYVRDEAATKMAIDKNGWFCSGDTGYYDEDEFFYIVGRTKEIIKYKGYQVSPVEIEALLLTHPMILDAAVLGLPHEEAGELPLAFVVKRPNTAIAEEEIKKFISSKVAPYKQLRGGVIFINEIPKNTGGKILRTRLRELLSEMKSKL